jgi:hypothetical protein
MVRETVMNVFPSNDQESRLVIALEQPEDGPSRLVLRQETRADKVGWFVQSRVAVMPEQIAGLRMALFGGEPSSLQSETVHARRQDTRPAILSFTEAAAQVG